MRVARARRTRQDLDGMSWVSRNDCFVVAVKLSETLLKVRSPDSTIRTDSSKDRLSIIVLERDRVVDRDRGWNAHDVQLAAVDTIVAHTIVKEDPFESFFLLSNS